MKEFVDKDLIPINDVDIYDLLQDRDNDENGSNGVWDLAHDLMADISSMAELEKGTNLTDDIWEYLYNSLQDFKDAVIHQYNNDRLSIDINNGQKFDLVRSSKKGYVIKEIINSKGNVEARESISFGDIVTMLNWREYQRNIGNKDLMF